MAPWLSLSGPPLDPQAVRLLSAIDRAQSLREMGPLAAHACTMLTETPGLDSGGRLRDALRTNRVVNIIEIRHQKRFVDELSQIYLALEQGVVLEPLVDVYPEGMRVIVVSGPLRGIRGVIAKIHNNHKLVLSVEGLGRAALSVNQSQVKPDPRSL